MADDEGSVTPALEVIARPRDGTILDAGWNPKTEAWPAFLARVTAQVQAEGYRGFRVHSPWGVIAERIEPVVAAPLGVAVDQAEPVAAPLGVAVDQLDARVAKALDYAVSVIGIDGAHHKQWGLDQMVRALTGCQMVTKTKRDVHGTEYSFEAQGESDEYKKLVADACAGEDGPATYDWDTGIAP
jgi:hypothetical protein